MIAQKQQRQIDDDDEVKMDEISVQVISNEKCNKFIAYYYLSVGSNFPLFENNQFKNIILL
ncbi:unnamed protein product [Paramecium pentaurelia]|uniref:Uncharacterized protein n=1 Tax=Paramecium pentaurelia TaxID=43138 RepID=A0A8S1VH28_9CILI|nr:unnamed protein product [Paramecium pentaurelia]